MPDAIYMLYSTYPMPRAVDLQVADPFDRERLHDETSLRSQVRSSLFLEKFDPALRC